MGNEPDGGLPNDEAPPVSPAMASHAQPENSSPPYPSSARGEGSGRSLVRRSQEFFFAGPLPHPAILKQYDEIVPGAADRILRQAEQQTGHRIGLETKVIDADIRRADRGLWAGLAVALVSIVGGCALVFAGHDWAGATIATATVVSLVTVFVYGSQTRKRERQERARLMMGAEKPENPPSEPHGTERSDDEPAPSQ